MGFICLELDFVHQFTAAESWKHQFICQFFERQLAAKVLVFGAIDNYFTVIYLLGRTASTRLGRQAAAFHDPDWWTQNIYQFPEIGRAHV